MTVAGAATSGAASLLPSCRCPIGSANERVHPFRAVTDGPGPEVLAPADELPADVLLRFADGDEAAFAQVYQRYSGPMFTVALRTLGRRDLAADAVQQAFLQAWRAAATVTPGAAIAPWLFTITRRCAIDVWRKESRHDPVDPSSPAMTTVASTPPGMEAAWEAWQVRSAVAQLTPDERDVVRLAYVEGLSQSEIANQRGLPLGTVKSRTGRAQRRLAQLLSHLAPEPPTEESP